LFSASPLSSNNKINWNLVYSNRVGRNNTKKLEFENYMNILAAERLIKKYQFKYTPDELIELDILGMGGIIIQRLSPFEDAYLLPEIGNLINLKKLFLGYNLLLSIPKEIGNLFNLEVLSLCCNKLKEIAIKDRMLLKVQLPKEISNLINLKILDVFHNKLKELPSSIKNLINLKILYIEMNKISSYKKMEIHILLPNTTINPNIPFTERLSLI